MTCWMLNIRVPSIIDSTQTLQHPRCRTRRLHGSSERPPPRHRKAIAPSLYVSRWHDPSVTLLGGGDELQYSTYSILYMYHMAAGRAKGVAMTQAVRATTT